MSDCNEVIFEGGAFRLVDRLGRLRAELSMSDDFTTSLSLFNCVGDRQARLAASDTGKVMLELAGDNGSSRLAIGIKAFGAPAITIHDEQGVERVELGIGDGGLPSLALRNLDGKTQVRLMVDGGVPVILLSDRAGDHRIALKVQDDDRVGLLFLGANAVARVLVGVNEHNEPQIRLLDRTGRVAIASVVMDENGCMRIEHGDG